MKFFNYPMFLEMFQTLDFFGQSGQSIKFDVCLPLAYPNTIYKHMSSFMPFFTLHLDELLYR